MTLEGNVTPTLISQSFLEQSDPQPAPAQELAEDKPLTMRLLPTPGRAIFKTITGLVAKNSAASDARIARLETRIAALEQRPAVKYAGVWNEGCEYTKANLCTLSGGLWIARCTTTHRPGQSGDWALIVKRGAA